MTGGNSNETKRQEKQRKQVAYVGLTQGLTCGLRSCLRCGLRWFVRKAVERTMMTNGTSLPFLQAAPLQASFGLGELL